MELIIVGYGRVGSRTARVLQEGGHDVTVIETDHTKAETARDRGLRVVEGDGSSERSLREAGVGSATSLAGLTGDPNVNFEACTLANERGCRTVMRISEDYREEVYDQYADAVDAVVYPERLGAAGAKTALLGGSFDALGDLTEELRLTTVTVDDGAPAAGRRVTDLDVAGARIYAHGGPDEAMTIPLPGTTVDAGDRLALLLEQGREGEVRTTLLG